MSFVFSVLGLGRKDIMREIVVADSLSLWALLGMVPNVDVDGRRGYSGKLKCRKLEL